jgi:hypothetical protein
VQITTSIMQSAPLGRWTRLQKQLDLNKQGRRRAPQFRKGKRNEVHVVTSGGFTDHAKGFASNKPIPLIDGPMLFQLIKKSQAATPAVDPVDDVPKVMCPKCGSNMVMRTANPRRM